MKIALYGRITEKALPATLQPFFDLLSAEATIMVEHSYLEYFTRFIKLGGKVEAINDYNEIRGRADVLLSLGGDGTLLETIAFVQNSGIPVLGINIGRLGFLAAVSPEEAAGYASRLLKREYALDKRTLLRVDRPEELFGDVNYALNEFTVQRKESSAMLTINTWVNGEFLNAYWADGLIISTPTGSTAYSLSCGGPLMIPDAKSFVITPLSPHNLNVCPLIIPDDSVIRLKVEGRSPQFLATLDARERSFGPETELYIRREDFKISLIRFHEQHFFQTIRQKLHWGQDRRN
ncbi:MAG: NAD kinase [Bacteroidia bacterium]|jgi:NAD+ kinase|nr:NAD kinase [Bacteroidia bacterium]